MLLNNRQVQGAVAGGIGGLLGWLLIEPTVAPLLSAVTSLDELYRLDAVFGALVGISIGMALGIAEGVVVRSAYRARRGGLIGAGVGLVGGTIGILLGEMVYQPLQCLCFVGRSLGWAVFGAFVGAAEGITRRSWRGLRNATLGGVIGGGIGGFMFDMVGLVMLLVSPSGAASRGVALVILGACIGLWIALLERVLAPATLKVISGPFEGRDFVLDKPRLTLGSNERGDIAIFGDPQLQGHHATLRYEDGSYVIQAEGGAALAVNGQPVESASLRHEDQVRVAQTRLIYRHKEEGAAMRQGYPSSAPPVSAPVPPVAPPAVRAAPRPALLEPRTGQRYLLRPGVTTIGRSGECDIVLDAPSVSAHHAEIRLEGGRYVLYDQGSRNGSFVNERRVEGPNMLKLGWHVQFGEVLLILVE